VFDFFFLAGDLGRDDVRDELVADIKEELAALSIGVGSALRIRWAVGTAAGEFSP